MDPSNTFCVSIASECQQLFTFTFEEQQYTYTRLLKGLIDSPTLFNQTLN